MKTLDLTDDEILVLESYCKTPSIKTVEGWLKQSIKHFPLCLDVYFKIPFEDLPRHLNGVSYPGSLQFGVVKFRLEKGV